MFRCALPWLILLISPAVYAGGNGGDFTALTSRVQLWVDRGFYPGAAVLVAKENRVIYEKCFGSYSPQTEVFIASAGKWLAAAAIMTLVDDGKLSLEDHPSKYLPEFKNDPKDAATLRQMLAHTSGYPPYQPKENPVDNYQTLAESVAHLLPLPIECKPGERFDYGGLAMQVAGRMAEVASGKDWETIFQERIAQPCEMTDTHFTPVDPSGGHAPMLAGGARSNLHDYANFLSMIFNNGKFGDKKVLSENAIREMQLDQVRGAAVKRNEFVERVRGQTHRGIYGLGEWREELDANGDAALISSPSWAGMYPWIDKKNGVYGLIVAHIDTTKSNPENFSGFWTSPSLAMLARAALEPLPAAALPNFQRGFLRVNGADFYYEMAGAGEPLIFVHAHSVDRRMWDAQFAEFAKTNRVVRYDLRGYGLSDVPVEGAKWTLAGDLDALMRALGIEKAHIAGLSLGAFVVGDFLALHPEKVLSATVADGGVYLGPNGVIELRGTQKQQRLAEIESLRRSGIGEWKRGWIEMLLKSSGPRADATRPALERMVADWSAWQPLHVESPVLLGPAVVEKLRAQKITMPVLGIAGERDGGLKNSAVRKLLDAIPNSTMKEIRDAGHFSNLDQPGEFNRVLREFIQSSKPNQPAAKTRGTAE